MSSMSTVLSLSSFNLLFLTQVLTVLTTAIKYNDYVTDKGKSISIPCIADSNIVWVKESNNSSTIIQAGKLLVFRNVSAADRGIYKCFASITQRTVAHLLKNYDNKIIKEISKNETNNIYSTTPSLEGDSRNSTFTTKEPYNSAATDYLDDADYRAVQIINLTVRTPPGPVTQLYFKASTILGFLIWRFDKRQSGGYPLKSFTAETRQVHPGSYGTVDIEWEGIDPKNIAPNVRQMEIYRLQPNTTYEFRIWANNVLGRGEVVTTNVTTLPEYKEEAYEDGWDCIELIPNIILNPGFSETDGRSALPPFTRTVVFDDDSYTSDESDHEPVMEKFKRKVSVFFTGPTIKRI